MQRYQWIGCLLLCCVWFLPRALKRLVIPMCLHALAIVGPPQSGAIAQNKLGNVSEQQKKPAKKIVVK